MPQNITIRDLPESSSNPEERANQLAEDLAGQLDRETLMHLRRALEGPSRCYQFGSIQVDDYITANRDALVEQGYDPDDPKTRETIEEAIHEAAENAGKSTIPDAIEDMVFDKVLDRLAVNHGHSMNS